MTEIVANSLDSGAAALHFRTEPSLATLTVVDDGSGMSRPAGKEAEALRGRLPRAVPGGLGLTPSDPARIAGLIEVPGLAESLTLNKADFIRTGPRGALYLAYRKGIQEAAAGPLAAWGAGGDARGEGRAAARSGPWSAT